MDSDWLRVVKVSGLGMFLLHEMVPGCFMCDQSTALLGLALLLTATELLQALKGKRK